MDTSKYQMHIEGLLADTNTYTPLAKDPTSRYMEKLIKLLKDGKQQGNISQQLYWRYILTLMNHRSCMVPPEYTNKGPPVVLSSQVVAA